VDTVTFASPLARIMLLLIQILDVSF